MTRAREATYWAGQDFHELAEKAGVHLPYAIAWARQTCGRWHFHVLLHDPSGLRSAGSISGAWWWGDVLVEPYERAPSYMVFLHEDCQLDVACPRPRSCRRRRWCRHGPRTRWYRVFLQKPVIP